MFCERTIYNELAPPAQNVMVAPYNDTSNSAVIFSTQSYVNLATTLSKLSGHALGELERKEFPDGESYHRILSPVEDRPVIIVSGTIDDKETMELFDLANAIIDGGASSLKVVLPYFGYATMERAVKSGEAIKAKYRARLLSSGLPCSPMGNRFYMLDLHSEGLPHYFEAGAQTSHVYGKPIVIRAALALAQKYAKRESIEGKDSSASFVFASTDAGRMKWVESLARDMGVAPAFAYKERVDGATTISLGVSGPVAGRFIVIYDDMVRTGSSLLNAARAYLSAGATGIAVVSTHALFPGDALEKIKASGLIKEMVVTDSHPRSRSLECDFLKVESCAELFLPYIGGGM